MSPSTLKSMLRHSCDGFILARRAVVALALVFLLGAGVHSAVSPEATASTQAHPPSVDEANQPAMNEAVSVMAPPSARSLHALRAHAEGCPANRA